MPRIAAGSTDEVAADPTVREIYLGERSVEPVPLLRLLAHAAAAEEHLVSLVIHHIAYDGWSESVLADDLSVAYAARVAGQAGAGEVMVSRTLKDLVAGSGIRLESRGMHALKGIGVVSTSSTWTMGICERARLAIVAASLTSWRRIRIARNVWLAGTAASAMRRTCGTTA